ncbi:MAG: ABC transporter substrate-binding protein [Deltaproteobacteria bacterium CG_4_9_14_3_um_filter_65_9]|nr:MAG: ABC transporter substrate-binding protein [Deltaproteobacteria bacterium CG_4_9_14_3_um_filter_65_9]
MRVFAMVAAMAMVLSGVAFSAPAIKVGHLADLTGPTGEVGKPYAQGVQDYKDWVNAHGGVNGKQIDMPMFDYAYDKNKAVNQYKKYKEDGVVAIQGWGSGDTEALSKTTGDDKIPYISASYSAHLTDPKKTPYNFFCAPDYTTGLRAGLRYLKDNWKEKRAPKVVFIYPNHPYGIAPIKGGKEYAKEIGFEVLGDEDVSLKAIEANSQLLSVKNKGADFAWVGGTTNSTAVILKDAKKLGLKTRFFINIWGADETTPKLAAGAEEGALVMVGSTVYGSKVPGMKQLMQITKNQPQVTHYIRGYVSMMVLTEALKIADKKGQLNGPGVKAALESLKNFDTGGLAADKITFSATDHRPFMKVNITDFQKGKLVLKKTIELPRKAEWLGL